jgi:hypothetical protein
MISISPWPLSFLQALRPPVEDRSGADEVGPGLQRHTTLGLDILQLFNGDEMAIDEHGIGQRPQMLSRLEFWRIRG